MKYAVCSGNTVEYGVAQTVGDETTVTLKTFSAGELIDFDDKDEIKRLTEAGVIRALGQEVDEVEVKPKSGK